tara:strand:- start:4640 stop:4906 length:267 start_codon:yes stop_codon:yes gene_type:complete
MKPSKCDNQIIKSNFKWKDLENRNKSSNGFDVGVEFKNGHWASVLINDVYNIYGYEILSSVSQRSRGYVKTYQTKKQVMNHLKYISKL